MEFEKEPYKVYIRIDEQNNITAVNSSIWVDAEWGIQIDEGAEYPKYPHAQGNYFDKPIITEEGIYRYKYIDGVVVEKTAEEIAEEIANRPAPEPPAEPDSNTAELQTFYDEVTAEVGL